MTILFGHPTGGPFSYNAALAHFEMGRLEAFCVPWMPSESLLVCLEKVSPLLPGIQRLSRRSFPKLASAPKCQGRVAEWHRLFIRAIRLGDEKLAYEANDWLMRTMKRESSRPAVRAVHAYEDCSLWQFTEAKRLGKACIYDMPIAYYGAWKKIEVKLLAEFADWLPAGGLTSHRYVRPAQKLEELELADLTMVPTKFAERTIREIYPDKALSLAPYGVDCEFWAPAPRMRSSGPLRFINAGQLSIRKGIPSLLNAWEKAALGDAELELVGPWQLSQAKLAELPHGVTWLPACSPVVLRERYRAADVFVFPSFFEGFGLVLLEAMACGLPAIASDATAGPDIGLGTCGRVVSAGNVDELVEAFRWFDQHRDDIPMLGRAARTNATGCTWEHYRCCLAEAVAPFL
jgi:alpha-maltose-1-phosphate synthase